MTSLKSRVIPKPKPRIVILGAGFGGIYTFLGLRRRFKKDEVEITIINRNNYFLFTPMLHEVATGGLAHHQVVESIRSFTYKNATTLHVAEIERIDTKTKIVQTSVGPVPYDILVIATGATTNFYNIPGAAERALILKDLSNAIKIRNRIIAAFEKGIEVKDTAERRKMLTFVLVGGGATGVELAAEMAELFYDTLCRYFCGKIKSEDVSIHLIAGGSELLPIFHSKMREQSRKILIQKGVKIIFDNQVVEVSDDGVKLSDGSQLIAEHVIWVAGVTPNVPKTDMALPIDPKSRRIIVEKNLRVRGHPEIFALGDVATFAEELLPTHAQMAVQAASVVAKNIVADIRDGREREFKYRAVGDLVSLGQWQAAGYFFKLLWTGPLAWFIWRTVYLFKFASWPKRIKIAVDWTIDIFYPRDITKA